jgi:hypothetical protein
MGKLLEWSAVAGLVGAAFVVVKMPVRGRVHLAKVLLGAGVGLGAAGVLAQINVPLVAAAAVAASVLVIGVGFHVINDVAVNRNIEDGIADYCDRLAGARYMPGKEQVRPEIERRFRADGVVPPVLWHKDLDRKIAARWTHPNPR